MPFKSIEEFSSAYKALDKSGWYEWAALDKMLVQVCSAAPGHKQVDEVFAKIAIINRTYRANLHFGAKEAEWKVAERFVAAGGDALIAPLRQFSNFSSDALATVLDSHEALVKLAHEVTGRVENSFVSKYLHFHFPDAVPVFDSYSYDVCWALAPLPDSQWAQYKRRMNCDYGYHCGAILLLIKSLKEHGVEWTRVKLLDVLLYGDRPEGQATHG